MASCNPVTVNSITYIGTIAVFTTVYFAEMPELPLPVQGCLLESSSSSPSNVKYLILALWNFHFLRRTIEVLFVHIYNRRMPLVECIGAPIYYWVLALLIAWSVNGPSYAITFLPLVIHGALIFFFGEFGNAWCHLQLRFFRTRKQQGHLISPETGHTIPHGLFFNLVSCPHYLFEIVSWLGFFMVTWTLSSALLLLFTIATLGIYAKKKHDAYVAEFDGEYNRPLYPKSRKRLIPFVV